MMDDFKNDIPQEGTRKGESLSAMATAKVLCPSYSGGAKNRSESTSSLAARQHGGENEKEAEEEVCVPGSPVLQGNKGKTTQSGKASKSVDGHFWEGSLSRSGSDMALDSEPNDSDDQSKQQAATRAQFLKEPQKRPFPETHDDDNRLPRPKVATNMRGKGRKTSGHYVGLAKAKAALNEAKREELRLRAEEEVVNVTRTIQTRAMACLVDTPSEGGAKQMVEPLASVLQKQVEDSLEVIHKVATKSGNLKGTFTKALKQATCAIRMALEELTKRTASDEAARLRAENTRLQSELTEIRKEFALLRADFEKTRTEQLPPVPLVQNPMIPDMEELVRSILLQVGGMVNARFEALEGRLLPEKRLRPPLAADRLQDRARVLVAPEMVELEERPELDPLAEIPTAVMHRAVSHPPPKGKKARRKKAGTTNGVASATTKEPYEPPGPEPLMPRSMNMAWTEVTKRGSKTRAPAPKQPASAARLASVKGKARPPKPPRSAAVVLSLQPSALERGITYQKVFTEVKQKVDLADLGIQDLRFKVTATGARMLELPGANSGDKADALAEKVKEVLNENDVRVSRPAKCVEMRISGLDDSVLTDEVAAAVARVGGIAKEVVKVGVVRRDQSGFGSAWVSCPTEAANKIISGGRLLVGIVSAQVKLLQRRPLRCFRCLETGHFMVKCTSEVNRSDECYRCGQPGHKAGQCFAAPHCTVCAAASKPAGHMSGSTTCDSAKPPARRKRGRIAAAGTTAQPIPVHPIREEVERPMEVV